LKKGFEPEALTALKSVTKDSEHSFPGWKVCLFKNKPSIKNREKKEKTVSIRKNGKQVGIIN